MVDDSIPDQLQCTNCLLPMQYQEKKDGKFLWQCFKCGKKIFVSEILMTVWRKVGVLLDNEIIYK